jgi:hypothetical protein
MAAAVAAQRAGGRYRRPLQKAGGGDVSGRYRKRPLQEAVVGSGRCRRPLQEELEHCRINRRRELNLSKMEVQKLWVYD